MRRHLTLSVIALVLLPAMLAAQAPPIQVPSQKPQLRRDQTQRAINPRIIQFEDERTTTAELLDFLSLSNGAVRRRTLMAIGRIGYPVGITHLVEVLNHDRSPEMRALAAFSLGEIESHYPAPDLLARLDPAKEPSLVVRARVAEALGKIAANTLSADALGRFGLTAIREAVVKQLPDPAQAPTSSIKLLASLTITALLRLKQPAAVPAIAAQLRSPDADLRWQAANALARLRDGIAQAGPTLLPLLWDKEVLVRANAARALGVAGERGAVEPLIGLLADPDSRVVATAVTALGSIADPRGVDALVALGNQLLSGYKTFDREKLGVPTQQNLLLLIAVALGGIKDPRGLPFLKSLRAALTAPAAAPEVEIAIAKFGEATFFDSPEPVKFSNEDWKAMAAYAQGLGELKTDRARSTLADLLSGKTSGKPDPRAVSDILNAMKAANVVGLKSILLEQLKTEDVIVRTTAATLLGELNDASEAVITALLEAYKVARNDKMNDARIAILEATDKLKKPLSAMALLDPTRDEDYVVRRRAAELLRRSPEEPGIKLQIGKVETGHDRNYWRRIAQLSASPKNPVATIHTKKGAIQIELFASDAPMTVDNFIQLSRSGFYNGLTFMRVVPNFVIQGGDPRDDMNGGPNYQIRDEINLQTYQAGTVGMALSGKDTGGSQFFITHSPQPHLDGGYTVFGQVISGLEAVNRIARGDRIERIEISGVK